MNVRTLPGSKVLMMTGIALAVLGILLLVSPAAVGTAVVKLVALVLILTGVIQLFQAFRGGSPMHSIIAGLLGAIVGGVGVLVWLNPQIGSGILTALLMLFFAVHGLWKINMALRFRRVRGWAWLLLSGLVALLFVYLLWQQWPLSGAWAIGVLVGLDLLLTGVAMILLAMALRKLGSSAYVDTISL